MFVLARTSKPLHKIAQAMSTLSLRKSRGIITGETIKLTNAIIKTLVIPGGRRHQLWCETEQRGFFVRKSKSGKATYGVKYDCRGQPRRITLGPVLPNNVDSMRKLAADVAANARALGIDEKEERQKARKA